MTDESAGQTRAEANGPPTPPENFPPYKHEFVQKALDTDGVVTEIEEHRHGYRYHAWLDVEGRVWMATIKTDREFDNYPKVTFRECRPGHDLHVLHSWSTVAVKRCTGPDRLDAWRVIFQVFHAANELLETHQRIRDGDDQ